MKPGEETAARSPTAGESFREKSQRSQTALLVSLRLRPGGVALFSELIRRPRGSQSFGHLSQGKTKCVREDKRSPSSVGVKTSGLQNTVVGDLGGYSAHLMEVR